MRRATLAVLAIASLTLLSACGNTDPTVLGVPVVGSDTPMDTAGTGSDTPTPDEQATSGTAPRPEASATPVASERPTPTATPTASSTTAPQPEPTPQPTPTATPTASSTTAPTPGQKDEAVITEDDSGRTFSFNRQTQATLRLHPQFGQWSEPKVQGSSIELTERLFFADPGYREWEIRIVGTGRSTITSASDPCPGANPPCGAPSRLFEVTIDVT